MWIPIFNNIFFLRRTAVTLQSVLQYSCTGQQFFRIHFEMGSILSVIWEAVSAPIVSLTLLGTMWVWVKLFLQEWDPRQFSLSYGDCLQKNQFWRVLLAPLSHNSFWMMLLNTSVMWNFRNIEKVQGSFFFLRYSVLLILSEAIITFVLIYFSMRLTNSIGVRQTLTTLNTIGSAGFILAWLSFESIAFADEHNPKSVVLLGWLNLHPITAPIVMVALYYFFLPATHAYSNLSGLLSGYLLVGGLLKILPDIYWSLCFLLDVALVVVASIAFREGRPFPLFGNSEEESSNTVLEVIEMRSAQDLTPGAARRPSSTGLRDLLPSEISSNSPSESQLQSTEESRMEGGLEGGGVAASEFTPLLASDRADSSTVISARSSGPNSGGGSRGYLSHLLDPSGPSNANSRNTRRPESASNRGDDTTV